MPLSRTRKQQCLDVVDRLLSFKIGSLFAQPVDPELDGCPTYLQVITHPMDLSTVRANLENDTYDTVTQWKHDMAFIWDNAVTFNGRNSLLALLARQLQFSFKELTEFITTDEKADWLNQANALRNRIAGGFVQPDKGQPKQKAPKIKEEKYKPPKPTPPTPTPASSPIKPPRPKPPPPPPPPEPKFTPEEINDLTEAVNELADDGAFMEQVVELIRQTEPELIQEEEVEIEVTKLKPNTLAALRALVDRTNRVN
jgi:hypothetical protein